VGDDILPADTARNAHHLRPDTVGVQSPSQVAGRVGEMDHEISDRAFLWGDALLRGLLRAVAVRHRAVHTGGEPDGDNAERADDGGIPAKLVLLGRLPHGGEHRGFEVPELSTRPRRMDDTRGRHGVLNKKLRRGSRLASQDEYHWRNILNDAINT